MGRHTFYTKITPLPANVPRLLALDLLHSHDEFIRLNPLVTNVKTIDPPRNAEGDEYFSSWYEISETKKVSGVKVNYSFKGCFHNQSWGMQSHVFAPMGIEFRNKYRIGGNQPGEPREDRELGVKTPQDGLYLREDISFTSNAFMASFVKKEMQDASQVMIDRMVRKAELLDEGKLHAMFENGRLKTAKPTNPQPPVGMDNDRPTAPSPTNSVPGSPPPQFDSPYTAQSETFKPAFQNYGSLVGRHTSQSARSSYQPYRQSGYSDTSGYGDRPISGMQGQQQLQPPGSGQPEQGHFISELPGSFYMPQQQEGLYPKQQGGGGPMSFRSELPGDTTYGSVQAPPPPNAVHPAYQRGTSPQPSPQMGSTHASDSARSSSYQITNPEQSSSISGGGGPTRSSTTSYQSSTLPPPDQARSSSHNSIQEWQRTVANDTPISESHYYNARNSHGGGGGGAGGGGGGYNLEPDHQRMANLSLQQNRTPPPASQQQYAQMPPPLAQAATTATANDRDLLPSQARPAQKCPVCQNFEGDEPAIQHHITHTHNMR